MVTLSFRLHTVCQLNFVFSLSLCVYRFFKFLNSPIYFLGCCIPCECAACCCLSSFGFVHILSLFSLSLFVSLECAHLCCFFFFSFIFFFTLCESAIRCYCWWVHVSIAIDVPFIFIIVSLKYSFCTSLMIPIFQHFFLSRVCLFVQHFLYVLFSVCSLFRGEIKVNMKRNWCQK